MNVILGGKWKVLFIGGPLDGTEEDFVAESAPPKALDPVSGPSPADSYRCVGYFQRGGENVLSFVCAKTTIADLDRFGVLDDLFIKRWQAFQLYP